MEGIVESPHETWTQSEDKEREIIIEKLKMGHMKIEVECDYRIGKPTTGPSR